MHLRLSAGTDGVSTHTSHVSMCPLWIDAMGDFPASARWHVSCVAVDIMSMRAVSWGHWGITFQDGERSVATLSFPVGPQGPMDGFLGSKEREGYRRACRAWCEDGVLPDGAVCWIADRWLYDPAHPSARWLDGYGWESAVWSPERRAWIFPRAEAGRAS